VGCLVLDVEVDVGHAHRVVAMERIALLARPVAPIQTSNEPLSRPDRPLIGPSQSIVGKDFVLQALLRRRRNIPPAPNRSVDQQSSRSVREFDALTGGAAGLRVAGGPGQGRSRRSGRGEATPPSAGCPFRMPIRVGATISPQPEAGELVPEPHSDQQPSSPRLELR